MHLGQADTWYLYGPTILSGIGGGPRDPNE